MWSANIVPERRKGSSARCPVAASPLQQMAWITTEGNAFNHATDRVEDVDQLAAEQKALGQPMKAAGETSQSGRVRQTAFLAAQVTWNSRRARSAHTAPASETSTESAYQTPLGLKVASQPGQLGIHWNGAAPAVAAAIRGTLDISEANVTQAIALDMRGLQEGYFAYTPKTSSVSIRFEVTAADGSAIAESIRPVATP